MSSSDPPLGAIVDVPAGRGTVRFCGTTQFAQGKWVGIELVELKGKNNGSIQNVEYFKCKPLHGVFVRPSQVKIVNTDTAEKPSGVSPPSLAAPALSRSTLGHSRTASNGRIRVPPVRNGVPSPRSESPQKASSSGKSTPPVTIVSRPKVAGTSSPTKRTSLSVSASLPPRSAPPRSARTSDGTDPPQSPVVIKAQRLSGPSRNDSPSAISPTNSHQTASPPPSSFPQVASSLAQTGRPPSSLVREIKEEAEQEAQELRAKIRVLEAKRSDDVRVIEKLESQLSDANHFVALRPKLQQKLATLQQEIIANRRALADSEQLQTLHESRMLDAQEQVEMAMLDKEVAEERAEAAELELQSLQEKFANLEIQVESMNGGGITETGETDSSAKSSLAYTQLEKHNERLKDALIRLRDVSHETEQEQRHRIAELERELSGVEELHSQYESTLIKLQNAENQVDDLKVQLDDALGAEEMLVQLTERNLVLGEKIEEMRITIEDLEALKELNDELEENHVETEKQLQDEIEQKDYQIREQNRKVNDLEDACQDLESTISQFRDLVLQLQGELDSLRTQTQNAQNESASAVSQTAAMMSLNIKLQSSASKNQVRNIELELRKIEAKESKELLSIVQPYLPQLYVELDSDATSCYLLFQRLAAKADLINNVVAQAHGLPESLNGPVSEVLVGICEMRGRICNFSTLCRRFATILRRCDVEFFLNIGRIYAEIAPLEKRIDMHIDLLRREEFREMECVSDIVKMHAQFEHLAESYFDGFEHDLGERELGYAQSFDNDLDMFLASIALTKTAIEEVLKDEDVNVGSDDDVASDLFKPLQQLLDQTKSAKVLSRKLTKRLEDLTQDSAALKQQLLPQLKTLNVRVPELVNFGFQLAQTIMPYLAELRNNKGVLQIKTILAFVKQIAGSSLAKAQMSDAPWDTLNSVISQLIQEAGAVVPPALELENVLKFSTIPPWVVRVDEIKASLAVNVEAERKVTQLNEEIQELARNIRSRDQTIQEAGVKIELMERRMDAVKKQADTISQLESEISKARKQERSYEEAIEQLQSDLDTLEQDNVKLKQLTVGMERQASVGPQQSEIENVAAVESNLETSYLLEQIEALRGALRYLRRENSYLKGQDLLREIQTLPPLPDFSSRIPTPSLDPSGSSSESGDSDSDSESQSRLPTLRSLATDTNILYRDVITFSSSPRVVDLSVLNRRRDDANRHAKGWYPRKMTPSHQLLERKLEANELNKRMKRLLEKASVLGVGR